MNILIIGPDVKGTKGGMAEVINSMLKSSELTKSNKLTYVPSHIERGALLKFLVFFIAVLKIIFVYRNQDVFHIHTASKGSFIRKSIFVILARLLHAKSILHFHGAEFDTFYTNSPAIFKKYIRYIIGKADSIIVLSKMWNDFFINNICDRNYEIVANGVDTALYSSCKKKVESCSSFLFLGRLGKRKGVYDLLEAVELITANENYRHLCFYLCGDGEVENVKSIVQKKSLGKNIEIKGWIDLKHKLEILNEVECLLLPSYEEALPVAILEAMASGKVVVSTKVGGIPDLVEHGKNGFLLDAGDVKELTEIIKLLSDSKTLYKEISKNNIEKIEKHYDKKVIENSFENIYRRLCM